MSSSSSTVQTATIMDDEANASASASDSDIPISGWQYLPDPVFLQCVSSYLSVGDLVRMSQTCRSWWAKSQDDYLWKRLFRRDFKVSPSIGLRPGKLANDINLWCIARCRCTFVRVCTCVCRSLVDFLGFLD